MVKAFEIPEARALFGACFMQYLMYGFVYVIEGCKYQQVTNEMREQNLAAGSQPAADVQHEGGSDDEDKDDGRDKPAVDLGDIQMEEVKQQPDASRIDQTSA